MENNNYCFKCMKLKGNSTTCPHCGYINRSEEGEIEEEVLYNAIEETDMTERHDSVNEVEDQELSESTKLKKKERRREIIWIAGLTAVVLFLTLYTWVPFSGPIKVPLVKHKTLEEAKVLLNEKHLKMKQISGVYSNSIEEGKIAFQNPSSGLLIEGNGVVEVSVSMGPGLVTVPSVINKSQSVAEALFFNEDLIIRIKEYYSDSVAKGKVISQAPSSGTQVKKYEIIEISVSKGKEPGVTNFPDRNLEAEIRKKINRSSGKIYESQVKEIVELKPVGKSIINLEGIQYLENLEWLSIGENRISDISLLKNLTKLTRLSLEGNQINDISALRKLTK